MPVEEEDEMSEFVEPSAITNSTEPDSELTESISGSSRLWLGLSIVAVGISLHLAFL